MTATSTAENSRAMLADITFAPEADVLLVELGAVAVVILLLGALVVVELDEEVVV
jgi:hypothetical protein